MRGLRERHAWGRFRGPADWPSPARALARTFADERDRWALWLPVCLGAGIAAYFSFDREPAIWIGPLGIAACCVVGLAGRRRTVWLIPAIALGVAALGLGLAQLRAASVAEPILEKRIGPVEIAGRLIANERRDKRRRILLDRLTIARLTPERTPARIRVTVRAMPGDARPGDRVTVRAIVAPPPAPAAPGAFDFTRRAYFQRLGGVGFAVSRVRLSEPGPPDTAALAIQRTRENVTARILDALEAPAGAVAAALMTGKGRGV